MFLINYAMGLIAFWYLRGWQNTILWTLNRLFSGATIPLWFFPSVLVTISNFLPLRLMYFVPISVYLGQVTPIDCLNLILQQFLWIGILYLLTKVVWRTAINKLVIQGG
jgi:ABC-2 type transport system permease protein